VTNRLQRYVRFSRPLGFKFSTSRTHEIRTLTIRPKNTLKFIFVKIFNIRHNGYFSEVVLNRVQLRFNQNVFKVKFPRIFNLLSLVKISQICMFNFNCYKY